MRKTLFVLCTLLAGTAAGFSQQSDFAVKKEFEDRYHSIAGRIDSAHATAELDSLKVEIEKLRSDFGPHEGFLDRALYPTTFGESMARLNSLQILTYDRVYLINTQGVRLSELEARIASLTTRLDSLTAQRDQLFGELQESRKSLNALRDVVKRLTANLQAKDRLIFALVDSIFLPYGKDVRQAADMQKEAIGQKLEKANVVTRVYEIATDNVKFLDVTQFQGKDYANLIDQYAAFKSHWTGLKEKMTAVSATTAVIPPEPGAGVPGQGRTRSPRGSAPHVQSAAVSAAAQAGHVDSVMVEWETKLNTGFWAALQRELTQANSGLAPFTDGPSFAASIHARVNAITASKEDPAPFVETIWKQRIDKEWREALSRESMLGHVQYAALDKMVSELSKDSFDIRFVGYIAGVLAIIVAIWFFIFRKGKRISDEVPNRGGDDTRKARE
jgi:hypothetical protein